MEIISFAMPEGEEIASALAAGMAIEYRRGELFLRLHTPGDYAVEMDWLGDRVFDALEHRNNGPGRPDSRPDPSFAGDLAAEMEESTCDQSAACTSTTISPDGMTIGQVTHRRTA